MPPLAEVPAAACSHLAKRSVRHQPRGGVRHDPSGDPFGRDLPSAQADSAYGLSGPQFRATLEPALGRYLAAALPELTLQREGRAELVVRGRGVYLNGRPLTPVARRRLRAACAGLGG